MRFNEVLNEKLAYQEMTMGLSQYAGDGYTLVGGYRSGGSSSNYTRLKYDIVSHDLYSETKDLKKSTLGFIEVFVDSENKIEGIVNIEIKTKGHGIGKKVISDIVSTAGGNLKVYDIQKSAVGFWEKMGAEMTPNKEYSAVITR